MNWTEAMTAMRAGNGVRRRGWDAWLDMWQSGPIGPDGRRKIEDIRMKTPLGYAATTGLKSSDVAATDWEIVPQSRRDEVERRAIMKLEPGHFYESRGGDVWCCYKSDLKAEKHCCAYCVRVSDGRIEYFFADGRYDEAGKREHTLLREVKS